MTEEYTNIKKVTTGDTVGILVTRIKEIRKRSVDTFYDRSQSC